MSFFVVLGTEVLKLRRSRITWISAGAWCLMVAMVGFFMWIAMNPGMAGKLGLLGQKANFALGGVAVTWEAFLALLVEMGGIGGMLFCSVILVYVFGREYAEGTAKNLLALPVGRASFVLAKTCIAAAWFALLLALLLVETLALGRVLGLTGFSWPAFGAMAVKMAVLGLLSLCASLPAAYIAVATRGYFAPLGFTIATLFVASVFGHTGWGPWCPWSIIGIYSGAAGAGVELGTGSWFVMAGTFLAGLGLTLGHEVFADNGQ
jgi:ABC-2 type transport system permease protein